MTPMEVRDRLEAIGFDLSKYSSSLAAIHTVLKRLHEAGELSFVELASGKFAYEWQRAPARALAIDETELTRLEVTHLERPTSKKAKRRRRK
jgi:hypothetical protein